MSLKAQDSVLDYFISTEKSEKHLDDYLTNIINSFLTEPSLVYAHDIQIDFSSEPLNLYKYLNDLKQNLIQKSTRTGAAEMIGHMTTSLPYFQRSLSKLMTALNQNMVKVETSSTLTFLEKRTLSMLHFYFYKNSTVFYQSYLSDPNSCLGNVCSGGTVANITAIWVARNKCLGPKNEFRGVMKEGIIPAMLYYKYKRAVVIASNLAHYSFKKCVDILGLGEDGLCLISTDAEYRMSLVELRERILYFKNNDVLIIAIVAIAGATETGSIDNIDEICRIGQEHGIHVHVDAAWGGPMIFSNDHAYKLKGIELADSITVDGHKQLYTVFFLLICSLWE